jgi:formylglycine-generating enzyme required for sulfatase activity
MRSALTMICGFLLAISARQLDAREPTPPMFPFSVEAAAEYQRDYAAARGLPIEFTGACDMKLVLIPPGTFIMGSPSDEPGHGADELQHHVTLTRAFYLGKHEVTIGQFRQFAEATGYVTDVEKRGGGNAHDERAVWQHTPGTSWRKPGYAGAFEPRDSQPVVHVSHTDALAMCRWLDSLSAQLPGSEQLLRHTLPSEAQWEWACRAGSGDAFWWGNDIDTTGKVANVGDRRLKQIQPAWPRSVMPMDDGHAFVAPVGTYRANAFGLRDMLGNVWEFCGTRHGRYPTDPTRDPGDLSDKASYSVRGGGWSNEAKDCRCATRNADPPHFGHSNLGFRVAVILAGEP